jgi:AbrB family looped-hinge helix DNA binding protein
MTKIYGASRIQKKGQVTIPKEARDDFNLKTGEAIIFVEEEGKLVIRTSLK